MWPAGKGRGRQGRGERRVGASGWRRTRGAAAGNGCGGPRSLPPDLASCALLAAQVYERPGTEKELQADAARSNRKKPLRQRPTSMALAAATLRVSAAQQRNRVRVKEAKPNRMAQKASRRALMSNPTQK